MSRALVAIVTVLALEILRHGVHAFIPLIDGGKEMPILYKGYFDDQIAKQASSAITGAIGAGRKKIEVNFPPVPNLEEVKFGTTTNQKFGKTVVAKDLAVKGGYYPGSYVSRNLVAYSNMFWAKKIASAVGGGILGTQVNVLTAEPVVFDEIKNSGVSSIGSLSGRGEKKRGAIILINPGGEETWNRLYSSYGSSAPFVILNNAYSTTYGLGNKQGYEEAYYLKRISKGYIFRAFPGPWKAYLEKPDGSVELLASYASKPSLQEVATLVREESFRRYAINNDRWFRGTGERL